MTLNPVVACVNINSKFVWQQNAQITEVTTIALVYSWRRNLKFKVAHGETKSGISCHDTDGVTIIPSKLPYMCKAIFFMSIPKVKDIYDVGLCDLAFGNSVDYETNITVDKKSLEMDIKSRRLTIQPETLSMLGDFVGVGLFKGYHDDIGPATSLVQGKFYRRSISSPWEYSALSVGIPEATVEAFMNTKTIFPLLSNYWYPLPSHLKIIVFKLSGLANSKTVAVDFNPIVEGSLPGRMTQKIEVIPTATPAVTAQEPYWGETILVRHVKKFKQKVKLLIAVTEGGNVVGDVTINAVKTYQESINNGQRCIDKDLPLKSKDKGQKLTLRLRFVAI